MKNISIGIGILLIAVLGLFSFSLTPPFSSNLSHTKRVLSSHQTSTDKTTIPSVDHIVVISMENKSFDDIVGNDDAPYINSLLHTYSYANNYFAVDHPSLPNYLALIGGSTFGITSDCTNCFVNKPSLIDQLETNQKTWKAYMESLPKPCFIGNAGPYAQKHDPFIYFDNIRNNQNRCNNIVPFTRLSSDLQKTSTTPNFIWISPNLCHDMHNCRIATGDTWLSQEVPTILNSPAFKTQNSMLVVTWDEGEDSGNNHILTLFLGNTVKKGYVSQNEYTHYSLLHTIETAWKLPALTDAVKKNAVITDIWQ